MPLEFYCRCNSVCMVMLILIVQACSGYDFDQVYTGIYFSPYPKHPYINGVRAPYADNYTVQEIEVMLEVITEKFSRVTAWEIGTNNVLYWQNSMSHYYFDITEMAAYINLRRKNKSIRIFQGVNYYNTSLYTRVEVKNAIHFAEGANQIFPGTVEGFTFTNTIRKTEFKKAEVTLHYLRELKNSSVGHLKFGTVMGSTLLYDFCQNRLSQKEMRIVEDILLESDFVTCDIGASDVNKNKGVEIAFEEISKHLVDIRDRLRQNYTAGKLEVIGRIGWSSNGNNKWDTLQNMKVYWELADQWARKHRFPINFVQAFDTPFDKNTQYMGWWKLTNNFKSAQKEGYIQKITESTSSAEMTRSIATILCIALGAVGLFITVI